MHFFERKLTPADFLRMREQRAQTALSQSREVQTERRRVLVLSMWAEGCNRNEIARAYRFGSETVNRILRAGGVLDRPLLRPEEVTAVHMLADFPGSERRRWRPAPDRQSAIVRRRDRPKPKASPRGTADRRVHEVILPVGFPGFSRPPRKTNMATLTRSATLSTPGDSVSLVNGLLSAAAIAAGQKHPHAHDSVLRQERHAQLSVSASGTFVGAAYRIFRVYVDQTESVSPAITPADSTPLTTLVDFPAGGSICDFKIRLDALASGSITLTISSTRPGSEAG